MYNFLTNVLNQMKSKIVKITIFQNMSKRKFAANNFSL